MVALLLVAVAHAADPVVQAAGAAAQTAGAAGTDMSTAAGALLTQTVGEGPVATSTAVRMLLFLTGLSFLPAMVISMTPFIRFVTVFSLLRQALGLNQSPPNQVIVGLSLFLTMLVMQPVFDSAWSNGLAPFLDGKTTPAETVDATVAPFRTFMLANTRRDDMATILQVAHVPKPDSLAAVPTAAVASAFVLSELKTSLIIAIYVFIPFLVIDLVVSSILLGMGMMMLPPVIVSLPFKLMVFVLMDGWNLLVQDLVAGIAR